MPQVTSFLKFVCSPFPEMGKLSAMLKTGLAYLKPAMSISFFRISVAFQENASNIFNPVLGHGAQL